MGTGSSSKTSEEDDVRNRLNSGDFQKISPPTSPSINAKIDEMSYSGILVEKPETPNAPSLSSPSVGASFAADLTTPPVSNRSKGRKLAASSSASTAAKEQPRRIVKATPPPPSSSSSSSRVVGSGESNQNDKDIDFPSAVLHSHASPIGANAATELLEESIEKNASKNKLRVTNKQKSDREKLLQEKRRRQQPLGSDNKKPGVHANPFSRFLRAFSVDANPSHKRKETIDAGDPNKRLKFGFDDPSSNPAGVDKSSSSSSGEPEDSEKSPFHYNNPWIAAASVATIAVLVIAIVRGNKKKY